MKVDDHLEAFQQHKEIIFDWGISVKGIENSQRIVGIHASRGIVELLSAYLHETNKIDMGTQINHRWFKSKKVMDKLPEFPNKRKIVEKLTTLELVSEELTYGSPKKKNAIKKAVELFNELESMINQLRDVK